MIIDVIKSFFSRKDKLVEKKSDDNLPFGCMYCRQFNGKGCNLTGIQFWDGANVAIRPKSCPLVSE